jgi:hypothetical protein
MTKILALPGPELAQAIDKRIQIIKQIDELELQKKELADRIVAEMQTRKVTKAMGTGDKGYHLTEAIKADYAAKAVDYAIKQGIVHLFTPPPKITRAKVMDYLKKKNITMGQFKGLQRFAGKDYPEFTLKTIVEAKADV